MAAGHLLEALSAAEADPAVGGLRTAEALPATETLPSETVERHHSIADPPEETVETEADERIVTARRH